MFRNNRKAKRECPNYLLSISPLAIVALALVGFGCGFIRIMGSHSGHRVYYSMADPLGCGGISVLGLIFYLLCLRATNHPAVPEQDKESVRWMTAVFANGAALALAFGGLLMACQYAIVDQNGFEYDAFGESAKVAFADISLIEKHQTTGSETYRVSPGGRRELISSNLRTPIYCHTASGLIALPDAGWFRGGTLFDICRQAKARGIDVRNFDWLDKLDDRQRDQRSQDIDWDRD